MLGLCKKSRASDLTIIATSAFKIYKKCITRIASKKLPPNGFTAFYFRALLTAYLLSFSRTDITKSDVLVAAYQRMQLC